MRKASSATMVSPFNGAIEVGLRALCMLTAAHPSYYSLRRLTICDYVLVHSDDIPGGPVGLHPQTPLRSGELLVRRGLLQNGLMLYHSRGLIDRLFHDDGVFFSASDRAAGFLDGLRASYVLDLRDRADWIASSYGQLDDRGLAGLVEKGLGRWGAEFTMQSVLRTEADE